MEIPAGISITLVAEHYEQIFPGYQLSTTHQDVGWSLRYAINFIRYALPWLIVWSLIVVLTETFFDTCLYGQPLLPAIRAPRSNSGAMAKQAQAQATAGGLLPGGAEADKLSPGNITPNFLKSSRLSENANVFAVQAAEHYIKIWSDEGQDLIRYKFSDALKELRKAPGMRVHRSWWVELSFVRSTSGCGRSMRLLLQDDLEVPVSLAHKEKVREALVGTLRPNASR